jgi:hypothetical protein
MSLFDAFIFVDWSATNKPHPKKPKKDALWIGELVAGSGKPTETYCRTRSECILHIINLLHEHVHQGRRVLLGFDFPYGYPSGFARALGLLDDSRAWLAIWEELAARVKDNEHNENNRFDAAAELNGIIDGGGKPGPYWGCPKIKEKKLLCTRSPGFPYQTADKIQLRRLRIVEQRIRGVQEPWKLFYNGSVGGQALVGIPYVHHLRRHRGLAHVSRVWPFETGFAQTSFPKHGPFILHAEIWPGVVEPQVKEIMKGKPGLIRDKAQVRAMAEFAEYRDRQGKLGVLFETPKGLDEDKVRICVQQEGWILGAI